ncbi:hypothetical protein FRB95_014019 [Tulasnella sp. JGI-2019a]|nr:hypothetical protein FRB95_014019 [Tulasnella sp. JGI-2019a]
MNSDGNGPISSLTDSMKGYLYNTVMLLGPNPPPFAQPTAMLQDLGPHSTQNIYMSPQSYQHFPFRDSTTPHRLCPRRSQSWLSYLFGLSWLLLLWIPASAATSMGTHTVIVRNTDGLECKIVDRYAEYTTEPFDRLQVPPKLISLGNDFFNCLNTLKITRKHISAIA